VNATSRSLTLEYSPYSAIDRLASAERSLALIVHPVKHMTECHFGLLRKTHQRKQVSSMADQSHRDLLKQETFVWNMWRRNYPALLLDLNEVNLSGVDLTGSDLRGTELEGMGVDLQNADLSGAVLHGVDLRGADLRGASLEGTSLKGLDLRGKDYSRMDLNVIRLSRADLRGAIF